MLCSVPMLSCFPHLFLCHGFRPPQPPWWWRPPPPAAPSPPPRMHQASTRWSPRPPRPPSVHTGARVPPLERAVRGVASSPAPPWHATRRQARTAARRQRRSAAPGGRGTDIHLYTFTLCPRGRVADGGRCALSQAVTGAVTGCHRLSQGLSQAVTGAVTGCHRGCHRLSQAVTGAVTGCHRRL